LDPPNVPSSAQSLQEETVDKCEDALRRAQGERKKSFEIKPPTAQAELVEASFRRKSTVSKQRRKKIAFTALSL
jgi:hypothetical protein